jgi:hypothetical protein
MDWVVRGKTGVLLEEFWVGHCQLGHGGKEKNPGHPDMLYYFRNFKHVADTSPQFMLHKQVS